ncbi:MAG: thioredoxin domain-containing protein [Acidobacteriia bacterium]|nr:thioredoxin domain-containing protein [Terriglobia bacterium]
MKPLYAFLLLITLSSAGSQQPPRSNRLAREKSPYLLQHARNPVDWYPWGEEAFAKAAKENKPIFLSIGYSTCHWCHVMERECFENEDIAAQLNRDFIAIKVDREERPDIDQIYMSYVMATTGHGGWPMSVWLTPARHPFFGGTYFPPDKFKDVLRRLSEAWHTDSKSIVDGTPAVMESFRRMNAPAAGKAPIDPQTLTAAFENYSKAFDPRRGGFGAAPKFPRPVVLNFLLRYYTQTRNQHALDMTIRTLKEMARGGIHDHLGGGFHRYSTDDRWFLPHFEKMLYDQAQLATAYVEAYQITGDEGLARVARGILDYVLRDMTSPEGFFYSAEDADSAVDAGKPKEKREGAFYVWTMKEINQQWFAFHYGVKEAGNVDKDPHGEFRGINILYEAHSIEETARQFHQPAGKIRTALAQTRALLLAARAKRPRPYRDDKAIAAWNGLMISAYAKAAAAFGEPRYARAAERAAGFALDKLREPASGRLFRRYRDGQAAVPAFLDDYAFLIKGLLDLYQTSFQTRHLRAALDLTSRMRSTFTNPDTGAFYTAPAGDPHLILRMDDGYDGAEPSGNSIAVLNLLRAAEYTDGAEMRQSASKALSAFSTRIQADPEGYPRMLAAFLFQQSKPKQIILVGPRGEAMGKMLRVLHARFLPYSIAFLIGNKEDRGFFQPHLDVVESMTAKGGLPTAYVCENYACKLPVNDPARFRELLQ